MFSVVIKCNNWFPWHCCRLYPACKSRIFCSVLCFHLWPVGIYHNFPHYVLKATILGGEIILRIKCGLLFALQIMSELFVVLRRTWRDTITNIHRSSCKVPVILVRLQWNSKSHDTFSKIPQIKYFMTISLAEVAFSPWGRTDGRKNRQTWRS